MVRNNSRILKAKYGDNKEEESKVFPKLLTADNCVEFRSDFKNTNANIVNTTLLQSNKVSTSIINLSHKTHIRREEKFPKSHNNQNKSHKIE